MHSQTPELPCITRPHCRQYIMKKNYTFMVKKNKSNLDRQPSQLSVPEKQTKFLDLQVVDLSECEVFSHIKMQRVIDIKENISLDEIQKQIMFDEKISSLKVKLKVNILNFKTYQSIPLKKMSQSINNIIDIFSNIVQQQEDTYVKLGYGIKFMKMKKELLSIV
ncbi:hypothetical protein SS50377_26375 [Spironucleus salmonicida]|uniref:Uncharacterized protein n=1 Tax=Spironucleus salmonicida TaxID=348837 RepID=V6LU41_9EUKA|nr:hypothetical protein SS50377_26375 [Spironucleus salmonicida]|eukprot:EST47758.1 Hypothetical protein SS50377_12157 [Spironucleus salmonicida]